MQTFLPYADFVESARALDPARLGKQRVEALQVLRAIVLPSYGWQNHPAMQMWRGYVPALTRYSLDMVDAWTAEGRADTTRPLIAEFAPAVDAADRYSLAVPSWLGNEALHLSHRSNLVRKDPEFYGPRFPGVPDDLPYLWPGADAGGSLPSAPPATAPLGPAVWILRAHGVSELEEWAATGVVTLADAPPRGKGGRAWQAQLDAFSTLEPGASVTLLLGNGSSLIRVSVAGEVSSYRRDEGVGGLRRAVRVEGEFARSAFPYPALLQDPRSFFEVTGPLL